MCECFVLQRKLVEESFNPLHRLNNSDIIWKVLAIPVGSQAVHDKGALVKSKEPGALKLLSREKTASYTENLTTESMFRLMPSGWLPDEVRSVYV